MNILDVQNKVRELGDLRYSMQISIFETLRVGDIVEYYPKKHWNHENLSGGVILTLLDKVGPLSFSIGKKISTKTGKEINNSLKYFDVMDVCGIFKINGTNIENIDIRIENDNN